VLDRIESDRTGGRVGLATAVEELESARER
jgi:hypothetical protein